MTVTEQNGVTTPSQDYTKMVDAFRAQRLKALYENCMDAFRAYSAYIGRQPHPMVMQAWYDCQKEQCPEIYSRAYDDFYN